MSIGPAMSLIVTNNIRQSYSIYCLYYTSIAELRSSGWECYWGSFFAGALCYADNLTVLDPSLNALRKMLQTCETFTDSHCIHFNGSKTQLICFGQSRVLVVTPMCCVQFCGKQLDREESVIHLGIHLTCDLSSLVIQETVQ